MSIYGIYIAPLQGNYSEAFPAQARVKRKVLIFILLSQPQQSPSHLMLCDCYRRWRHCHVNICPFVSRNACIQQLYCSIQNFNTCTQEWQSMVRQSITHMWPDLPKPWRQKLLMIKVQKLAEIPIRCEIFKCRFLHKSISKILIYMRSVLIKQYFTYFIRKLTSLCN